MASQDTQNEKVYPGGLDRYVTLRQARELHEANGGTPEPAWVLAEEMAGLAYILDGIRYSLRNK